MTADPRIDDLAADLDEALTLLTEYRQRHGELTPAEPLPSLLDQCREMCAGFSGPEPLRSLHHFACTGGTLLSKCVAALPNVVLLSEIDPLCRLQLTAPGQRTAFAPTDIIRPLLQSPHGVDEDVVIAAFQAAIEAAQDGLSRRGQTLVLRDHAHSQFCTEVDYNARPSLHEILATRFETLSLVTIRHPLDSFISVDKNRWGFFEPFTLDEYARRYLAFLDRHEGLPILKYETFVQDPETGLKQICACLDLIFQPLALDLIAAMPLSGDSGRSSPVIAARERRPIPEAIDAQRNAPHYVNLCLRMGYDA